MNSWISKFIKPKIKSLFKKKSSESKEALWVTCECKNLVYKDDLFKNLSVCPNCGFHHKISCEERFKILFDKKEFKKISTPSPPDDPLGWKDTKKYTERLKAARKKTNQSDAILIAEGKVNNIEITAGAQNFDFIGGSVGAASGEAFIHGVQNAIDKNTPFIFFTASGGQRMMESAVALSQMSRTVLAVNELKKMSLPYIVIMCNPTSGGVSASFGFIADIIVAEVGATVAFAGRRVIESTVKEQLPPLFQKAEFCLEKGQIDAVIERKYIRNFISTTLEILLKKREAQAISASGTEDVKSQINTKPLKNKSA